MNFINYSLRQAIAKFLDIQARFIKAVERWSNCYFVRFVFGSPRFVSLKVVEPLATAPEPPQPIVSRHVVLTRTAIRHYGRGIFQSSVANSRGLFLLDIDTGKKCWVQNPRCDLYDPMKDDAIEVIVYPNGTHTLRTRTVAVAQGVA